MLPKHLPLTPEEIEMALAAAGYASQEEAAKALDVRQGTLSRWMSGRLVPGPEGIAKLQKLKPRYGRQKEWADYLAGARVRADLFAASIKSGEIVLVPKRAESDSGEQSGEASPGPQTAVSQPNSDELANKVVGALPKPRELARLVSLRVAAVVRRLVAGAVVQVATLQQALGQVTALLGVLKSELGQLAALTGHLRNELEQKVAEVGAKADSVETEVRGLHTKADVIASEVEGLHAKADVVETGVQGLGNGVQMLHAKMDSIQGEVQQLQTKADALGSEVQQLHVKADGLGTGVQQLRAKSNAHHRESRIQFRAVIGTMAAGFAAVIATVVACTHSGGPSPGAAHTTGGGVTEEAVSGAQQSSWKSWLPDESSPGIDAGTGERKKGDPVPHHPLPGQAVAPCRRASSTTLYGGCWMQTAHKTPCPPDLFQEGDACYAPIEAKPNTPHSVEPDQSGQETPSREQTEAGMPANQEDR